MNTIGERFKMIIEVEKLNEYSFSKRIGKSNTAISKIVKGESKPGFEIIEAVLNEFPTINTDWLIHGTGQMVKSEVQRENVERPDNYLQSHLTRLEENFQRLNQQIEVKDQQIATKDKQIEYYQRQTEQLIVLLGKTECVTEETGVYKHPATAELEEEGMAQLA
jgi:transcriptional regulator with XRE-family HTH domain